MSIATLKCPVCGANVDCFEVGTTEGWCPYCGNMIDGIAALQEEYAVCAESEDLLQKSKDCLEKGSRVGAAKYARKYLKLWPTSFIGNLALMDALGLPDTEIVASYWDRTLPELTKVCIKLSTCAENDEQRELAERRRLELSNAITAMLPSINDELGKARTLYEKLVKDTNKAESHADKMYSEYQRYDTGELKSGDGEDSGLIGSINTYFREMHNDVVTSMMKNKESLREDWQRANARCRDLRFSRARQASIVAMYESRLSLFERQLESIETMNQ